MAIHLDMKGWLFFIFILGFLVRLGLALEWGTHQMFGDEPEYDRIAENIIAGKGPRVSENVVAQRLPGYSYFLASIKKAVVTENHYQIGLRAVQSFLSSLLIYFIYWLGEKFTGPRVALMGALLFAFNPLHTIFSGLMLTESIFSFLLFFGVLMLFQYTATSKVGYLLLSAVFFSFSLYIKETPFLIVPFYFFLSLLIPSLKQWRGAFLALSILVFLSLVPWTLRNHQLTGQWIFLTSNTGLSLYDAVNPNADGGTDVTKFNATEELTGLDETEQNQYRLDRSFESMKSNPLRIVHLAIPKLARFWNMIPNFSDYRRKEVIIAFCLYYIPLFLLLLRGIFTPDLWRYGQLTILFVPILYFTCLHMVINGSLRYRMPIEPFIILIAMLGLHRFVAKDGA